MRIDGTQIGLSYLSRDVRAAAVLFDIDIRMGETGIYAVTGPSGCGKSSLLYVLSGLKAPTSGTVYYDDVDIQSYTVNELAHLRRSRFGFIFQRPSLLESLSALDNVLIHHENNQKAARERGLDLLARLDIDRFCEKKPHVLSQGQRQRVAVARALANDPAFLFADEPTAALDRESTDAVMRLIKEHGRRASVLLISHDPLVLEQADKVIYMRDGRITTA
jgi:putative ABC transport system ATP-binding protein